MKNILITGASSGFGKLTVNSLLEKGFNVAATMRNTESKNKAAAEELSNSGAKIFDLDVTDDQSVQSAVEKATEEMGSIDVVINNAGIGVIGMQEHFTPDDFQRLFDINVVGVQRVNRAVLPQMREKGSGLLIHVSSLLGRMTLPFYGPYNASKWALEALAENYRVELSGFGIESCIVEPGGFATDFMHNLMTPADSSRNESYGEFMNAPQQMGQSFGEALANNPEQNPQKVADAIVGLIEAPAGDRPMRTIVDNMGMGDHIKGYNDQLENIMQGIYGAFGMKDMLNVKK